MGHSYTNVATVRNLEIISKKFHVIRYLTRDTYAHKRFIIMADARCGRSSLSIHSK